MNKLILLSLLVFIVSCHKDQVLIYEQIEDKCWNDGVGPKESLEESLKKIQGTWILRGLQTFSIGNNNDYNLKLVIKKSASNLNNEFIFELFRDDKKYATERRTLKEMRYYHRIYFIIETEATSIGADEYNFLKGTIKVCDDQLIIDNGSPADLPAYLFHRK